MVQYFTTNIKDSPDHVGLKAKNYTKIFLDLAERKHVSHVYFSVAFAWWWLQLYPTQQKMKVRGNIFLFFDKITIEDTKEK